MTTKTLIDHFEKLSDPRIIKKTDHKLIDIVTIAICAVIGSAATWEDIELYGTCKKEWLESFLELPNGIPSHDTFNRVFSLINPDEFEKCFHNWIEEVVKITNGEVIAIDGKTLRRSYDNATGKKSIHMVSAWASGNGVTLGQIKVNEKSNEITAIPDLLDTLYIKGCIVTIDAMGCQKKIARKIIENDADYILNLKNNQEKTLKEVTDYFNENQSTPGHDCFDESHGRTVRRRIWVINNLEFMKTKELWPGLETIGVIESIRSEKYKEKISCEFRYYLSSTNLTAKEFGEAVQTHWSVENQLHWTLDVAFREDESRIRKGFCAQNFSMLRRIALNLLKREKTIKYGVQRKRNLAGWDNNYLMKVIFGSSSTKC